MSLWTESNLIFIQIILVSLKASSPKITKPKKFEICCSIEIQIDILRESIFKYFVSDKTNTDIVLVSLCSRSHNWHSITNLNTIG